jgi:hypothetical protein
MRKTLNNVRVNTATVGTGSVVLGAAYSNKFATEAEAGAADGETYRYKLEEGNDWEIGEGVYTSATRTLTRATVIKSKISGTAGTSKMSLAGAATLRLVATADDFNKAVRADEAQSFSAGEQTQARSNISAAKSDAYTQSLIIAVSDETTSLTTGTGKVTFRMPHAMSLTAVKASLTTAQASGSIFTVDVNKNGTTILSTKLTIDNTEKTSKTAATPAVISVASLAEDDEITIDIDQIGNGSAQGLKVVLIGTITP